MAAAAAAAAAGTAAAGLPAAWSPAAAATAAPAAAAKYRGYHTTLPSPACILLDIKQNARISFASARVHLWCSCFSPPVILMLRPVRRSIYIQDNNPKAS